MATAERKGRQFQCWLRPHVPTRIHWRLYLAQGRSLQPQCGLGPVGPVTIHRGSWFLCGDRMHPSVGWVHLYRPESTEGWVQLYERIHHRLSQRRHPTAPISVGWVHLYRPESTEGWISCTNESTVACLSGDIRQPQSVWDGYTCTDQNPPRVGSVVQTNPP